MRNSFYITTPIYYPNGEPHLGHVYTTLAADAIARYHRLVGDDTFFLTGTDEHGVKMVKTAAEKQLEPSALADVNVKIFQDAFRDLHVSNDDFIRTTSDRHKSGVAIIYNQLLSSGDIYLGAYEGWYDEGQEQFVTETEAKDRNFLAFNRKPLVRYAEPTYFFRLKQYGPKVLEYIENNPAFIQPMSRRNEVISKLKQGVEDLSISRATLKWGIPLPNDPGHVLYVWIDALSNYITALGYGADDARFKKFWPVNVHLIGKEIMWFHTVYWPAMLMALGIPLPKQVFAHGWWTADGRKMSKTEGNFIDLPRVMDVARTYSEDALRYYLLRAAPFGSDLDWSDSDFNKAFNELANVLGNGLNRTVKMIGRYRGGKLPAASTELQDIDRQLVEKTGALPEAVRAAFEKLELQQCAMLPIDLVRTTNGYIDATEPFKLAKDPGQASRLDTVLNLSCNAIYRALVCLLPILPDKAHEGLAQLRVDAKGRTMEDLLNNPPAVGATLGEGQPLFPKVDPPK